MNETEIKKLSYKNPQRPAQVDLFMGCGLLTSLELSKRCHKNVAVITDTHVRSLYGETLVKCLESSGCCVKTYTFPAGESSKTRETKESIEDKMLDDGFGRDTTVIGLGGGVVTDLAGFVAATYCRGIPLILCPTTLLSMVDASIGGKSGVNTKHGKNMIGAIWHPEAIFMDTSTLKSLPTSEWANGLVEMIKHAVIKKRVRPDILTFDEELGFKKRVISDLFFEPFLLEAIYVSCETKISVVEKDDRESGYRRILNFGHTIGHAIEKLSEYQISHGQAVALGSIIESKIACELGYLKYSDWEKIERLFRPFCPEKVIFSSEDLVKAMSHDKKRKGGRDRLVILNGIGSVNDFGGEYCCEVALDQVLGSCI